MKTLPTLLRRTLLLELGFFALVFLLSIGPFSHIPLSYVQPLIRSLKSSVGVQNVGTLSFAVLIFRHNALPLIPFAIAVLLQPRRGRWQGVFRWISIILYLYNVAVVGAVLGVAPHAVHHMSRFALLLRGILPHGIFEIGAFSLLLAASFKPVPPRPWRLVASGYALLVLAALIESFVTPVLLR